MHFPFNNVLIFSLSSSVLGGIGVVLPQKYLKI